MSRIRRLTVQGWLNLVLSIMGLVVVIGAGAATVLLIRTDRMSDELAENIQPSRVAAQQLQSALRDQETAVRGYVIAADRQFPGRHMGVQQAGSHAAWFVCLPPLPSAPLPWGHPRPSPPRR